MKTENTHRTSRKKKRASTLFLLPLLVILVIGLLFAISSHRNFLDFFNLKGLWEGSGVASKPRELPAPGVKESVPVPQEGLRQAEQTGASQSPAAIPPADLQPPSSGLSAATQAVERINAFYTHLDAQAYLQDFHLGKPSKEYFGELSQKLLNNQPVVSRETDDIATVIKNTTHFFRIAGKDNITILKAILDREKPYLETMLADYYSLSESPDILKKSFSLQIPPNALYEYAGYFLNTIGGRLYLFRRDPSVRLTVTYYSILALDKANQESNNRNGIQINTVIDGLIAEMEGSGNQLRFKDRYLDKLYELKEKYQ